MRACASEEEEKFTVIYFIDKEPVGSDMAFAESEIIADKLMILKFRIKRIAVCERRNYKREFREIEASFLSEFKVFFKLIRGDDFKFHSGCPRTYH